MSLAPLIAAPLPRLSALAGALVLLTCATGAGGEPTPFPGFVKASDPTPARAFLTNGGLCEGCTGVGLGFGFPTARVHMGMGLSPTESLRVAAWSAWGSGPFGGGVSLGHRQTLAPWSTPVDLELGAGLQHLPDNHSLTLALGRGQISTYALVHLGDYDASPGRYKQGLSLGAQVHLDLAPTTPPLGEVHPFDLSVTLPVTYRIEALGSWPANIFAEIGVVAPVYTSASQLDELPWLYTFHVGLTLAG